MMYLDHFGLASPPFSLTPDSSFLFEDQEFRKSAETVVHALAAGEGIIKVTGDVGTGKTLLCRQVLRSLEGRYAVAYLLNPLMTLNDLSRTLADEFGVTHDPGMGFQGLLNRILEKLILLGGHGRKALVLVDEAQSLPDQTLEALRLMTNLETEKEKIVQLVLFGQKELDERLERSDARSLKQRIATSLFLQPMDRRRLTYYINHRLAKAGCHGAPLFARGAIDALHAGCRGTPRLANILAQKSLQMAAADRANRVERRHVKRAIRETEGVSTVRRDSWVLSLRRLFFWFPERLGIGSAN